MSAKPPNPLSAEFSGDFPPDEVSTESAKDLTGELRPFAPLAVPSLLAADIEPAQAAQDEFWMRRALELAAEASVRGEIPVGAVIVQGDEVVSEAANIKESNQDPLGHAEVLAIRAAAEKLGRWRLSGCTLYVTLEPCTMCAGAIIHSRLDRIVYAATDPKAGAVESLYQILDDKRLNHTPLVTRGVLQAEASEQLKSFFRALRERLNPRS